MCRQSRFGHATTSNIEEVFFWLQATPAPAALQQTADTRMKKQKFKKHRPSYSLDQHRQHHLGIVNHHQTSTSSSSSSSSHQQSALKSLVTELTRELPLTTQSRKALPFPSLLESLSQHLVARAAAAAAADDDDDLESLQQVHTLLLLALSYHVQRFHSSTHNQHLTAPLLWLSSIIRVLGQLYQLQQHHRRALVTQSECQESLTILLQTLMKWSVLMLSSTSSSYHPQPNEQEGVDVLMGLVGLTNTLCSWTGDRKPRLSVWFQHGYCPRVLQKLISYHSLTSHQKNEIQKILVRLQELQRIGRREGEVAIGEAKLGWCEPVVPTRAKKPSGKFDKEEYALVAAASDSTVIMNLPVHIVKLLASTDNDNQMLRDNGVLTVDQVKQSVSTLVRCILQAEYEHDRPSDWEISRREALRTLLPLLEFFLLLEDTWSMIIPQDDWVAIARSLLQSCSDDGVVHNTTLMLCRLLPHRLTATVTTIFHRHVSLLSALSMVLAHPFTPIEVKREVLHVLFRLTHGDDDQEYQLHHALFLSQMARAPMVLQSVSHILATSSTSNSSRQQRQDRQRAMCILMALSRPVSNHRIVAQQNGVLASMIRFVRHFEDHDDDNSQTFSGRTLRGGREALKERILQIAEAL